MDSHGERGEAVGEPATAVIEQLHGRADKVRRQDAVERITQLAARVESCILLPYRQIMRFEVIYSRFRIL